MLKLFASPHSLCPLSAWSTNASNKMFVFNTQLTHKVYRKILLEKLTVARLAKILLVFYETQSFITVLTKAHHRTPTDTSQS